MADKNDAVSKIDVEYVAELARISLSAEEKALFQQQLEKIVAYVNDISMVDVENAPPTAHSTADQNVFRRDECRPGLDRDAVLHNAPVHDGRQFLVPKIV
ncbi:MAG: Asp-tRNA(Asn)/Glu-tRNA(Gln) amidotransferase subunit GatC [Kiritimatiellae bacterium]|nr:Asp-tRNA(Asn)/Glu-tRNA(Gln) amidotransferase subunit GatC [Kiritimatiellia bacterium]